MKHVFLSILLALSFLGINSVAVAQNSLKIKKICLPKMRHGAGAGCYLKFLSFATRLSRAYIVEMTNGSPRFKFRLKRRDLSVYSKHLKTLNTRAMAQGCYAMAQFFCRKWLQKKKGKLVMTGYRFQIGIFKNSNYVSNAKAFLRSSKMYGSKKYVKTNAVDTYFDRVVKSSSLRVFTKRFSKCSTHLDCNTSLLATTPLTHMCMHNLCKKVACSQATSTGDKECAGDLFCGKPQKNIRVFKCMRKLADGKVCDRHRMCAKRYCNSLKKCGRASSPAAIKGLKSAKVLGSSCSQTDTCDSASDPFLVCDPTTHTCKVARGKYCTRHFDCRSSDYCTSVGANKNKCAERIHEGGKCGYNAYSNHICKKGLSCKNKECKKVSSTKKTSDSFSRVTTTSRGVKKKYTPADFSGVWKKVSLAISAGGGFALDLQNTNRQTVGGIIGVRVGPRKFWLGGHAQLLWGSSANFPNHHIMLELGATFRILNPDNGHGFWVYASYVYWGRNVVSPLYHETSRHGLMVDARYEFPFGKLWLNDGKHFLSFVVGVGVAQLRLDMYNKSIVPQMRLLVLYTFHL